MKVYSFPTFNLTKVLYTAELLELPYELFLLDVTKGEHKTPELLARNPLGKVPVVEWRGQNFNESNAICRMLAEECGNGRYGDTVFERTTVNQRIDFMGYHVGRWMAVYFFEEGIKAKLMGVPADPLKIAEAAGYLTQQLPVMDALLAQTQYFARDHLTIADTIAFAYCQIQEYTSLDLSAYPQISAWYKTIAQLPAVARGLAKLPGGRMPPFPN